jgi:NAD(P)-dependent dehydrogenase (short-subunit alcohol dehydrogenase family)
MSEPASVAVVTGAASGIGRASALRLAHAGFLAALLDRDAVGLAATAGQIEAAGGASRSIVVDLRDGPGIAAAVREAGELGSLRTVVNAGGVFSDGDIVELEEDEWNRVIDINLTAAYRVCRAAVPLMTDAGGGTIVNISSMGGRTKAVKASVAYASSKGGVIAFTQTLAAQCAKHGIRVNCVAPGPVKTPMTDSYDPAETEMITRMVPLGRYADPAELGEIVHFLATDASSFITGETVNANGGMFTV